MTFFNVRKFNDDNKRKNTVSPNTMDTAKKVSQDDDKDKKEIGKELEGHDGDRNKLEWQILSRILDKILFMLNIIIMIFVLCYGYIILYTH